MRYICSLICNGCLRRILDSSFQLMKDNNNVTLIAFKLASEDRDRRETPVLSRSKIAIFALHKRG
jgi:hypothetical protein